MIERVGQEIREWISSIVTGAEVVLRVVAPETIKPHRSLIERIIESEKPVYVTNELVFTTTGEIIHE
jgi:hypothetical protein